MTEKEKYTLFLLEKFRTQQNITAKEAFDFFDKNNVFDYIEETYDAIHTEDSDFVASQLVDCAKNG
jgi:ADP-dependent phosphofructokinase/glucokinase